MDSLVNRWKSTVDAQKQRQRSHSTQSKTHTQSPARDSLKSLENSHDDSFNHSKQNHYQDYIKAQAQNIIDILSIKGQDPPSISSFNKVCNVIGDIIKNERSKYNEENNPEAARLREMRESQRWKSESINKTVSDLEARLFESEREKILLKKEKEELKTKIGEINKQLSSALVTQEIVGVLKESFRTVEKSNKALISSIDAIKSAHREKERTWELEIEQLNKILEHLYKDE
ncbi:unnamed protein product [Blepharisma stoltei]|uniref:Uncharacterized protein n=1 Tax=Blepharisma stoltei TaxID=1481888 RepID=A0AAU9JAJ0_9CILI|nr:unnamed protein product [Blepharisma stoltei]